MVVAKWRGHQATVVHLVLFGLLSNVSVDGAHHENFIRACKKIGCGKLETNGQHLEAIKSDECEQFCSRALAFVLEVKQIGPQRVLDQMSKAKPEKLRGTGKGRSASGSEAAHIGDHPGSSSMQISGRSGGGEEVISEEMSNDLPPEILMATTPPPKQARLRLHHKRRKHHPKSKEKPSNSAETTTKEPAGSTTTTPSSTNEESSVKGLQGKSLGGDKRKRKKRKRRKRKHKKKKRKVKGRSGDSSADTK